MELIGFGVGRRLFQIYHEFVVAVVVVAFSQVLCF